MAEKYGTIPEKFTKEWWEYFWEYYKIHTIVIVAIIVAVAVTVYQSVTAPKYDFFMTYTSMYPIPEENAAALTDKLSEYVVDINDNGEKLPCLYQYVFSNDEIDAQYLSAMISKLQLEFVTDDTMLFIFSEDKAQYFFDSDMMDGAFQPVNNWLDSRVDDSLLFNSGNNSYAVSLRESKLLKDLGIYREDLYVGVRNYSTDKEENAKKLESAKNIANILVK